MFSFTKIYYMKSYIKICSFLLVILSGLNPKISVAQSAKVDAIINDFYHHPERVLVTAHRSAHLEYPENSIASIKAAIKIGADIAELDVRKTKDNVMVLMHDKTIDRMTNKTGKISSYTYDELKKIPLLLNGKSTDQFIPTFKEALLAAKGKIMIDIDFKLDKKEDALKVIQIINETGMQNQVIFFLYDYKYTSYLQSVAPSMAVMPRAYNKEDVLDILNRYRVPVIHIDDSFYDKKLMNKIRKENTRVWCNALGKYDELEKIKKDSGYDNLLRMNAVNVIQTDYPAKLLQYLRKRGLHR